MMNALFYYSRPWLVCSSVLFILISDASVLGASSLKHCDNTNCWLPFDQSTFDKYIDFTILPNEDKLNFTFGSFPSDKKPDKDLSVIIQFGRDYTCYVRAVYIAPVENDYGGLFFSTTDHSDMDIYSYYLYDGIYGWGPDYRIVMQWDLKRTFTFSLYKNSSINKIVPVADILDKTYDLSCIPNEDKGNVLPMKFRTESFEDTKWKFFFQLNRFQDAIVSENQDTPNNNMNTSNAETSSSDSFPYPTLYASLIAAGIFSLEVLAGVLLMCCTLRYIHFKLEDDEYEDLEEGIANTQDEELNEESPDDVAQQNDPPNTSQHFNEQPLNREESDEQTSQLKRSYAQPLDFMDGASAPNEPQYEDYIPRTAIAKPTEVDKRKSETESSSGDDSSKNEPQYANLIEFVEGKDPRSK